jgi:hypothetical protein
MKECGRVGSSSVSESESIKFFDDGLEALPTGLGELLGMFDGPLDVEGRIPTYGGVGSSSRIASLLDVFEEPEIFLFFFWSREP